MPIGLPAPNTRPVLIADGTEGIEGRALLLISALHIAAPQVVHCDIRFAAVQNSAVKAAIDVLRWDTGLTVSIVQEHEAPAVLAGAALYLAIAFRRTSHLALSEARHLSVPTLIAVQFPEVAAPAAGVGPPEAHDPALYAWHLVRAVGQL